MNKYLYNIVSRLKNFSSKLDCVELFVDIPWVLIDESLNQEKYIFRRNGELVMSKNGLAKIGKWEYLQSAKSLLIDRVEDKILLNQAFIDPGVMALKRDGLSNELLFLANEILIPDLDIEAYLKKLYYTKAKISTISLSNGNTLEIPSEHMHAYLWSHTPVSVDGQAVENGIYNIKNSDIRLIVENSSIVKVLVRSSFNTDKGNIVIEHPRALAPKKGDYVFKNNTIAPDGKYKLGLFQKIIVQDGKII